MFSSTYLERWHAHNLSIKNSKIVYTKLLKKNKFLISFFSKIYSSNDINLSFEKAIATHLKDYYEKLKVISKDAPVLVEGAGGAFSPLALDGLNIDLMKMIGSLNILIIKDELGCISGALSNILAFEKYKVRLDLLILNTQNKNNMDNFKEIRKYTSIPMINYTKSADIKTIQDKISRFL